MIRVVLDTNVFIAGLLSPAGAPAEILDVLLAGEFEAIACPTLLNELRTVLARPRFRRWIQPDDVERFVARIHRTVLMVDDPDARTAISRDPDDDLLFALAQESRADVVVSGDNDVLDAADPGVPVLSPRAFLDALRGGL